MKIKKDIDGNDTIALNYEMMFVIFPANYSKASPLSSVNFVTTAPSIS